ncbi:MAG: STAS domain-containing protein [Spirochaetota bacterium]
MFTIETAREGTATIVRVKGEATIAHAKEMHDASISAVMDSDTVIIDTDGVTEADLSFLQFIDATHKLLLKDKKSIGFYHESISPAVKLAAQKTGYFTQHRCVACTGKCLMHALIA